MNYTTFIDGLKQMLDISDLPEEAQEEIVSVLSQNILTRTNLAIASMLQEDEAEKMNELLEKGLLNEAISFLSEKHPELDEKVVEISKEVVDEFLKGEE
jgi:hypothetical protein